MSKKICLDAGHVGSKYNQSPVVKTYYESAMVWALHLKLKAQLEARGFQVVTTRASIDTDLGVYERGTASKGCDVFISLHSNACGTESVDYPVVYRAYDNKNNVDTLALKLAKKVGELMGTTQAGRTATRKNSSGGEYYGVLRGARAVGTPYYMLIEHSFHTNTKATKWLSEDANLDKLAVAEADILAEFFGMESSTETEKTAIMGKAQATASQMAAFCLSKTPPHSSRAAPWRSWPACSSRRARPRASGATWPSRRASTKPAILSSAGSSFRLKITMPGSEPSMGTPQDRRRASPTRAPASGRRSSTSRRMPPPRPW